MSILLSAYYPEGIVFVADKNITVTSANESKVTKYVEPIGTKVLSWPRSRAIVGYVGVASLAGYSLDEWLRIFIAETRDFTDIRYLAQKLKKRIQCDFSEDYQSKEVMDKNLIIHLGGFAKKDGVFVPVLYRIGNNRGKVDPETGHYPPGERIFYQIEEIKKGFKSRPDDYPKKVRDRLQDRVNEGSYLWYNNGSNLRAFNVFKKVVWDGLQIIEANGFAPNTSGIKARVAFCKMAVDLFGSYFTHYFSPEDRVVGGGADAVWIPWPG